MKAASVIAISRCESCHSRFLPRPGPCPRCGGSAIQPVDLPGEGTVLAAVELLAPAAGWSSPHRLVLVELAEDVRVLAVAPSRLPAVGSRVPVRSDGPRYWAAEEVGVGERGEGETQAAGASRPPFEPPR